MLNFDIEVLNVITRVLGIDKPVMVNGTLIFYNGELVPQTDERFNGLNEREDVIRIVHNGDHFSFIMGLSKILCNWKTDRI